MPVYAFTMLLTTVTSLGLGFYIWLKNKKVALNVTFGLTSLTIGLWSLAIVIQFVTLSDELANFMPRINNAFSILIPMFWLHLVLVIINKVKIKKELLILFYILAAITSLAMLLTDSFIEGTRSIYNFNRFAQGTTLYYYFLALFTLPILFGMSELFNALKTVSGIKRLQIKYLIGASLVGFSLGLTTAPAVMGINFYPIGVYATWLFVPLLAYSVYKHHLFDIPLILRRSIIYSILIVLVTAFYSMAIFISQRYFEQQLISNKWLWAFIASFIIALTLGPLHSLIAKLTDKIFFKNRYDYKEILSQANKDIASVIELAQLTTILNKSLLESVKVKSVSLFILDKSSERYIEKKQNQNQKNKISVGNLNKNSPLVLHLLYTQKPIICEELEQKIIYQEGTVESLSQLAMVKDELKQYGWSLSVPLILKKQLIGILNLGPKLSGDTFSNIDISLLTTLANQAAVAVENASVYEKEKGLSQAKSEFISVASHRLRTPLSVIKWALSLLDEDKANLSPKQRELVGKALSSNISLIGLANNLLDVSRIEEKKVVSNIISIRLNDLISNIVAEFKSAISAKELQLEIEKPEEELPKIDIDYQRMKIALKNIINNSIFYTPKNGKITISLKLKKDKNSILISIKDTGIGIPRLEQERIFDKFFRADNAISFYTDGVGLGLFIAKSIIEEHNGQIWFKSQETQGSTFYISLKY